MVNLVEKLVMLLIPCIRSAAGKQPVDTEVPTEVTTFTLKCFKPSASLLTLYSSTIGLFRRIPSVLLH